MIIGIDGNDANVKEQVGVSVYTWNLLSYFQKKADEQHKFLVFLRQTPLDILPTETDFFKYKIISAKTLWSQIFLPLDLYLHKKIDVFFSPAHYSPRFCPAPTVVTIHDLAYYYYPNEFLKNDLYKLKNWTKYSVEKATKVIAVSKTTKKDIMKFYGIPDTKIDVIYNGFGKKTTDTQINKVDFKKIASQYGVEEKKYILYVGTLQPRKNIPTIIKAFQKFKIKHPEYKLVLTGKKGWLYETIFDEVEKLQLNDSVIFTGYLPDDEVSELYKHAYCYVLPSLYEGFGIPLLEAMSNECPVISSFASCLPEIGGEACVYFDPENVNGLVDDLESMSSEELRHELIEKGNERVKLFSWEKCAEETLSLLTTVPAL